jgi:hypothetical protein
MHPGFEYQSLRVHKQVALTTFDLFITNIPSCSSYSCGLHGLAIYNTRTRFSLASCFQAY